MDEEAAEADASPEPERRLIESTLWKEDVKTGDHPAVWGSFYDPKAKLWGYACCRSTQREGPCTAAEAVAAAAVAGNPVSEDDYSPDSEDPKAEARKPIDWSNAPKDFLPRSSFNKGDKGTSLFIEHFVRFGVGAWHQRQETGFSEFKDMEKLAFEKTLPDTMAAITPLLKMLMKGQSLERGERKEDRGRSRETRTSMEGKHIQEASVKGQLERMAVLAYEMDYVAAHKAYMLLTLGHKTWNNTTVLHVAACTMKGAREYRRNRDNLNTYDMDPTSARYMHAMRKLVHFCQLIRPSSDQSKNIVL